MTLVALRVKSNNILFVSYNKETFCRVENCCIVGCNTGLY